MRTAPARRLPSDCSMNDLEPGDYTGPRAVMEGAVGAVWFRYPVIEGSPWPGSDDIHHVISPPHTFRECEDGSLEIRNSIGGQPRWHGFLDEGNIWRELDN